MLFKQRADETMRTRDSYKRGENFFLVVLDPTNRVLFACSKMRYRKKLHRVKPMPDPSDSQFIFVCTQKGAESVCKAELAKQHPALRFSFSRPGFLTYKVEKLSDAPSGFVLKSVFARAYGHSLGQIKYSSSEELRTELQQVLRNQTFDKVHLFSRDLFEPGKLIKQFPDETDETGEAPHTKIEYAPCWSPDLNEKETLAREILNDLGFDERTLNFSAKTGERVLDLILIEEGVLYYGWHLANSNSSRFVGGIPKIKTPEDGVVSRAYLKLTESLIWSKFPLQAGDQCVEIGSAPGGSCQALLEKGARVVGIDPAEMSEKVSAHKKFLHIKKRGHEVRCKDLEDVKWLFTDANVDPKTSMEMVERIVTHESTNIRGMILTMKLLDWKFASSIDGLLMRVKNWGFKYTKARQLGHNRQEICVVALRHKNDVRFKSR